MDAVSKSKTIVAKGSTILVAKMKSSFLEETIVHKVQIVLFSSKYRPNFDSFAYNRYGRVLWIRKPWLGLGLPQCQTMSKAQVNDNTLHKNQFAVL